jgi:hypothetical protein
MATKTADNLMGAGNPNHPDGDVVRREEIRQLKLIREELESERAELLCASRLLNDRLVKQAVMIDTQRAEIGGLREALDRARGIIGGMHIRLNPHHAKKLRALDPGLSVGHSNKLIDAWCPTCAAILGSGRPEGGAR